MPKIAAPPTISALPGSQSYWFYESQANSQIAINTFVAQSRRDNDQLLVIIDAHCPDEFDWRSELPAGTRTVHWDDLPGTGTDLDRLVHFLAKESVEAQTRGYRALRVLADVTRLMTGSADQPAHQDFSRQINSLFESGKCLAVWQVDATRVAPWTLLKLAVAQPGLHVGEWSLPGLPSIPPALIAQVDGSAGPLYGWLRDHAQTNAAAESNIVPDQFFEHIFHHIYQFVGVMRPDGTLMKANQAALSFGGLQRSDVVGRPLWEAPWWSLSEQTQTDLQEAIQRAALGEFVRYEVDICGQNANTGPSTHTIDFSIRPIQDEQGRVTLLIAEGRDISDKKVMERVVRERETLLEQVVSHAPVSIFLIDPQGFIQMATGRGRQGLSPERSDIVGCSLESVYPDQPQVLKNFQRALAGEAFTDVLEVDRQIFETYYTPYLDENGQTMGVLGIATNTTERRAAEIALDSSRARFQTIFEESEMGIALEDLDGRVLEANPAFRQMLGYSQDELKQRRFADFTHPADLPNNLYLYKEIASGRRDSFRVEKRYIRKNGGAIWGRLTTSLVRNPAGSPEAVIIMVEDITAQKQVEADLQELQRRLLASREGERLRLAQDIHDGPLQELYALSYQARELEDLTAGEEALTRLRAIQTNLQLLARSLRSVSIELRPPALVPFGLEKAIHSHAENFQTMHPEIQVNLDLTPDGQQLSEQVRMALFRIYQELLTNVVKHGHASQVWIRLSLTAERVELMLRDNGKGFEVPRQWLKLAREGHLGLVGSRERAESVGGTLEIQSAPGQGATILASVPRGTLDESLRIENAQYK